MVGDALLTESTLGQPPPHPLAVAGLEVMWPTVRPNIDAVETIVELLGEEEGQPDMEDEVIVVSVAVRAIAEEIDVLPHTLTVADVLQYDDTILHHRTITLMSDFPGSDDAAEERDDASG